MDVSKWPLEKIMQLPRHFFGRRWPVFVEVTGVPDSSKWDISEIALPDVGIIWHFGYEISTNAGMLAHWRLAWGDKLPTETAEMDELEPVFHGLGKQGKPPRTVYVISTIERNWFECRQQVEFKERRLILEVTTPADKYIIVRAWIIVSSIPKMIIDRF